MVSRRAIRRSVLYTEPVKRYPESNRGEEFRDDLMFTRHSIMDENGLKSTVRGSHVRGSLKPENDGLILVSKQHPKIHLRKQKTNKAKKPATKRKTTAKTAAKKK